MSGIGRAKRYKHGKPYRTIKGSRSLQPVPMQPAPNGDQSYYSPGVRECSRDTPTWHREFHQEFSHERRLLESMCG